jgi:NADH-quinone oxidoreductase subunit F
VRPMIRIGMSTSDRAAGAEATYAALDTHISHRDLPVAIKRTGSLGVSHREPLVEIIDADGNSTLYGPVTAERVRPVLDQHFGAGVRGVPEELVVSRRNDRSDYAFLGKQVKVTTQLCGVIDPYSLEDYLANDGYKAFEKALTMTPDEVIEEVKTSKLRGRGGAGFPTGLKWGFSRQSVAERKYVICNADEGDPGAFMDRSLIEGDPHRLLEGILICAYAVGACKAYIYVRAEYPLAVKALRNAVRQLNEDKALSELAHACGDDFEFVLKEGAGAFVCGEETALMHSIEGLRGMPRMRPPYPSQSGLWGYPTNINNVETLCSVPSILLDGGAWFAGLGTEKSGGTKTFALAGDIKNSGLIEVPLGMPLREIIYTIGGGCEDGKAFKAVQLGGPSGGCIPASLLDTPVDYENLQATGAIMGSGGMVVMNEDTSMVRIARYFMSFIQNESCGKCLPCRVGTRKMLNILDRLNAGQGTPASLEQLQGLCETVGKTSLCGLGQTAPNPVRTTLRYFRDEYEAAMVAGSAVGGTADGRAAEVQLEAQV